VGPASVRDVPPQVHAQRRPLRRARLGLPRRQPARQRSDPRPRRDRVRALRAVDPRLAGALAVRRRTEQRPAHEAGELLPCAAERGQGARHERGRGPRGLRALARQAQSGRELGRRRRRRDRDRARDHRLDPVSQGAEQEERDSGDLDQAARLQGGGPAADDGLAPTRSALPDRLQRGRPLGRSRSSPLRGRSGCSA
jgi:hypothetical protein